MPGQPGDELCSTGPPASRKDDCRCPPAAALSPSSETLTRGTLASKGSARLGAESGVLYVSVIRQASTGRKATEEALVQWYVVLDQPDPRRPPPAGRSLTVAGRVVSTAGALRLWPVGMWAARTDHMGARCLSLSSHGRLAVPAGPRGVGG